MALKSEISPGERTPSSFVTRIIAIDLIVSELRQIRDIALRSFYMEALIYLVKNYKKLALPACFMQNICCYPIDSGHLNIFTPYAGQSNILLQ